MYQCDRCSEPICNREAKFCTNCGEKIKKTVPSQYLIDGKVVRWNVGLIAFWIIWGLGGLALFFNHQNTSTFIVMIGVVGLVSGGIFITKSGSIKEVKSILIDSRTIECDKNF